ncbi:MAG: hypothetical protein ABWY93_18565 [Mycobacterium sp.]
MTNRTTASRLTFGGAKYLLENEPGVTIYRSGVSATNLLMRVWTASAVSSATGAVTFTIPAGTFTTVQFIELTVMRDTADPTLAAFAMLRSFTTTSVVGQVFESKNTGVLLGGFIEGLDVASAAVSVMVKVTGV